MQISVSFCSQPFSLFPLILLLGNLSGEAIPKIPANFSTKDFFELLSIFQTLPWVEPNPY